MRAAIGGFLIALLLFAGAWTCWSQAQLAERIAVAHQRLAVLQFEDDEGIDEAMTIFTSVPLPGGSLTSDVRSEKATRAYWRSEYQQLMNASPLTGGNRRDDASDPDVMFVAANAAFRASMKDAADRAATVDRLDRVIQAYADVLRVNPMNADASYNYEYVTRFRDAFAKTRPRSTKEQLKPNGEPDVSVDLPIGPTIHGRPGGPPQDLPMQQFRTVTPMRFEEREELEPGRGPKPKRRG
jgi:hypothetical protein